MKQSVCLEQVIKLIALGNRAISNSQGQTEDTGKVTFYADDRELSVWLLSCRALSQSLGEKGKPWEKEFDRGSSNIEWIKRQIGSLEGLKYVLENGLLSDIEDFVRADLFSDMLEQAEYLFTQGFHIAAAVVARSVFEEHLRKKCTKLSCLPSKPKAMLGDYITELQKGHVDAIGIAKFRAMAVVANAAAHGNPVTASDIDSMIMDVREVLFRYPN